MEETLMQGGLLLACLIVFCTTGLFVACVLPSGAVLFSTGVMVATQNLPYPLLWVLLLLTISSMAGSWTGFFLGRYIGSSLYKRKDSFFYKRAHLDAVAVFYGKHGKLAIAAAYFLPIIRSFSSVFAGVSNMNRAAFSAGTTLGSLLWVCSFTFAGFLLGSSPELKPMLGYIVAIFLCVVTLPIVIKIARSFRTKKISDRHPDKGEI